MVYTDTPFQGYPYNVHNTSTLYRYVVKHAPPNEISIKSHLSTECSIVGHDHLLSIAIGISPTSLICSVNSVQAVFWGTGWILSFRKQIPTAKFVSSVIYRCSLWASIFHLNFTVQNCTLICQKYYSI